MKKPNIKIKITKDQVENGAKAIGLTILTVVGAVAKNSLENVLQAKANEQLYKKASYSGVISAIVNSNMWDSYKEKAIEIVPKNADPELYGSLLAVILSDQWDKSKVKTIETLCRKAVVVEVEAKEEQ